MPRRVLIAGMGNVLRGDDGFGVEVIRHLAGRHDLPPSVRVVEVGIGGIPLVQELLDGYDLLILVDAVRTGRPPGTLVVLEPTLPDLDGASWEDVTALVGDPHTTDPSRVLLLARAAGALPNRVLLVGCEALDCEDLRMSLTPPVAACVDRAVERILGLVRESVGDPVRV